MIQVTRETHETPEQVQEQVTNAGGRNPFGEPNFRIVWGGSRLAWIGGRWMDRASDGHLTRERVEMRRVPKYQPVDRWHIERWIPAESYGSPAQWYAQTTETENGTALPALGPYPARGEYEHCFTLQGPGGEFVPLTPTACLWIVKAVEWARRQPRGAGRAALRARETRRERDWNGRADAILDETTGCFTGGR